MAKVNSTPSQTIEMVPGWIPDQARAYLAHVVAGRPIRALARGSGCHASTILRRVRRMEQLRDDFLIDAALVRLGRMSPQFDGGQSDMGEAAKLRVDVPDDLTIEREARRVLRRLTEPGACLAVARDMENAVVVRDTPDGRTVRTAVVGRAIAEAMALKEWLVCAAKGRISRYKITATGRAALKRILASETATNAPEDVAADPFGAQHRDFEEAEVGGRKRKTRFNLSESPLQSLARRKDRNGAPFLAEDLVAAGERLREDFELAQLGPRVTQNWDRFLTTGDRPSSNSGAGMSGSDAARERVQRALSDLGPGLSDVALRTCCFLEGMEAVERRLGWAARSGKIVLRIALQRLKRHYDEQEGGWSPMIG